MAGASVEARERFLSNLRLVNERAQVEPEIIDLVEAFARLDLEKDRPVTLHPGAPRRLSPPVEAFLEKNRHLSPTSRDFLAAYCQRIHEQGQVFLLNPTHLAHLLDLSPDRLGRLARTTDRRYFSYTIPKRDGSDRTIHAPNPELKNVQRLILDNILSFAPLSAPAEGFRRERSIVTNGRRHVGKKVVVKLDIKDFFPSITVERIFGLYLAMGYPRSVASLLTDLTTYQGALPTGAPTSPVLSNLVCRRLDRRLSGVGVKMDFEYSRYADDLTFSSQNPGMVRLLPFLQEVIAEEGFVVKKPKTRIQRSGGQQKVTGIVVNRRTNIARKEIRTLRAIIHNCKKGDIRQQASQYAASRGMGNSQDFPLSSFKASLRGKIDHVRRVNPEVGGRLLHDFKTIPFNA
jgi:retron-type reverse transcriptase